MTGGGPLPVREFKTIAEMQAHVAAVRERLMPSVPVRLVVIPPPRRPKVKFKSPGVPTVPKPEQMEASDEAEIAKRVAEARAADAVKRTSRSLLNIVSEVTRFPPSALTGISRLSPVVKARHISAYLLKKHTKQSLPQIGRVLGGRDHTTILSACRRVAKVMTLRDIPDMSDPADMAQRLWEAEWPTTGKVGRS